MIQIAPQGTIMKPRLKGDSARSSNGYNPITIFTVVICVLPSQSCISANNLNWGKSLSYYNLIGGLFLFSCANFSFKGIFPIKAKGTVKL